MPQVPTYKETITFSEFIHNTQFTQVACHFIVAPAFVVVCLPSCHLCFNWQGALICQTIPLQSKLWAGCGHKWTLSNKAPLDTHAKTWLDLNSFFSPLSYQLDMFSQYIFTTTQECSNCRRAVVLQTHSSTSPIPVFFFSLLEGCVALAEV